MYQERTLRIEPVRGLDEQRVAGMQAEQIAKVMAKVEVARLIAGQLASLLPDEKER
jgi:hypothetical protein